MPKLFKIDGTLPGQLKGIGPRVAPFRIASPDSNPPISLGWLPSYPDYNVAPALVVAAVPFIAAVFAVSQWSVPAEAWQGSYPERVAVVEQSTARQQFIAFVGPQTVAPVAPLISAWKPDYDDQLYARPGLPTADQQHLAHATGSRSNLPVPVEGWDQTYPDWIPAAPRAAEYPFTAFAVGARSNLPVPVEGWDPTFVDYHPVAPRLIEAAQQFVAHAVGARSSLPVVLRLPIYPDIVPGPIGLRADSQQFLALTLALPQYAVPARAWSPVFQDYLPRAIRGPEGGLFETLLAGAAPPFPILSWHPTYPDYLQSWVLPTSSQQALAYGGSRSNWPVPLESWETTYPDYLLKPTLPTALQQVVAHAIAARASLPVPWSSPVYPVTVPGYPPMPTAAQQAYAHVIALSNLRTLLSSWAPDYPVFVLGPKVPTEGGFRWTRDFPRPPAPPLSWHGYQPEYIIVRIPPAPYYSFFYYKPTTELWVPASEFQTSHVVYQSRVALAPRRTDSGEAQYQERFARMVKQQDAAVPAHDNVARVGKPEKRVAVVRPGYSRVCVVRPGMLG